MLAVAARWTMSEPHGAAVICTPVEALPDIIEHERTGLIVKPGDVEGLASDWVAS